jgi:hypothetical protein
MWSLYQEELARRATRPHISRQLDDLEHSIHDS